MAGGTQVASWIASDVTVRGALSGDGDLVLAGELHGDVWLEGTLHVRSGGVIFGDARCACLELDDGGRVEGQLELLHRGGGARAVSTRHDDASASCLGAGLVLTGSLETPGDLRVLGRVSGALQVAGKLTVEEGAVVEGAVSAGELDARGRLEPEIGVEETQGQEPLRVEPGPDARGETSAHESKPAVAMPRLGRVAARRRSK